MEETMRLLMRSELMRSTPVQLAELSKQISDALPDLSEGSIERDDALTNLANIRCEQFRRAMSPRGFSR
jgi:hypothetical protein